MIVLANIDIRYLLLYFRKQFQKPRKWLNHKAQPRKGKEVRSIFCDISKAFDRVRVTQGSDI